MASISAAKLREGQRGVAAYDGRELPCLDEVNQGVDEGSTVRARVDALQAVEAVLQGHQGSIQPPPHRQVTPQRLLGVAIRVHHLLARQVERRQQRRDDGRKTIEDLLLKLLQHLTLLHHLHGGKLPSASLGEQLLQLIV